MPLLLLLFFVAAFSPGVKCAKTMSKFERQVLGVKNDGHNWFWPSWNRLFGNKAPKESEWKDYAEKVGEKTFDDALARMEEIDREYEKSYQRDLLKNTDIFIIAPTLAVADVTIDGMQSTLNPELFNENDYNIVFKFGEKYPKDKPFIIVYLTVCQKEYKPNTKELIPIQAFFYDRVKRSLHATPMEPTADQRVADKKLLKSAFKLDSTSDGAFMFKWTVPPGDNVFPNPNYCFVFAMSSLNPADLPPSQSNHNLHYRKPVKCFSLFCGISHYYNIRTSHTFRIGPAAQMFKPEWFNWRFGGRDLERFIGGGLFSAGYFQLIYDSKDTDVDWDENLFQAHIMARANSVADWFVQIIRETEFRFQKESIMGLANKYDGGIADAEDRRKARMRAVGLLYHPNGRKTLEIIGEALIEASAVYTEALGPYGEVLDFIHNVQDKFRNIWNGIVFGLNGEKSQLRNYVKEMKLLFGGSNLPTEERMNKITEALGCAGKERVRIPRTDIYVTTPKKLFEKVLALMGKLAAREIRLIVTRMGEIILEKPVKPSNYLTALFARLGGGYDYQMHFAYAAALKQYGTKFVWMSKNYALFKEDRKGEDEL